MLRRLERERDITSLQRKTFLAGVRKFFSAATEYLTSRFPFEEALFQHAKSRRSSGQDKAQNLHLYSISSKSAMA